jgi:tripartite-type tricarboxylate transporter receptor subunit TctC
MPRTVSLPRLAALALAAASAVLATSPASAQPWPTKPVRIVVPFAPGGGTDILMRVLAPQLSTALGQQVVIENKPGASSIIGTEQVTKSAPDGYTLLAVDTSFMVNPSLRKLPYDSEKDLVPVIHLASAPVILVLHPTTPAKSVSELVALAKSKPGGLSYASGGNGASTHLAGEQFKMVAGIDIVHIPYKGTGPAMADVVAGQVPMIFAGISSARQYVDNGRLLGLAVTSAKRNPAMPAVPTFAEVGLPGVDSGTEWGLLAPAGTSREVVMKVNAESNKVLQMPEIKSRVIELGFDVAGGTPEAYATVIRNDTAKWGKVVKQAGIKVD